MGLAIGICIKYPGGGTWINATDIYIYIYCSMAGHLRMADTPAGGGQADVNYGWACMLTPWGKGGYGGNPNAQRGGKEGVATKQAPAAVLVGSGA